MIKEIYIRTKDDPNYIPNMIDFTDEVESVITQIRMIIGTPTGSVLGNPSFGVDLEDYIFNTKYNASVITEKIQEQMNYYLKHSDKISVSVDLKFGDSGKGWDFGILDIYINGKKTLGFLIDKNDEN